jgi:hypothetical protein
MGLIEYEKALKFSRLFNIIGAASLGVISFFRVLSFGVTDLRGYIMTFYYLIFGLLLLLIECRPDRIMKHFHFLHFSLGRGFFALFIGGLCISTEISPAVHIIVAVFFIMAAVLYFVLACCFKEKERERVEKYIKD